MKRWLVRQYLHSGILAAPPGTALHRLHAGLYRVIRRRPLPVVTEPAPRRGTYGAVPYYDIRRQRQLRQIDGLALVFFMGAGDYLMATPLIRALHLAHPDLPIHAFASGSTDTVSSALVHDLLKVNPLVDRVVRYDGRPRDVWINYDFAEALEKVPPNFLVLPVIYDVDPQALHRTTSLLETFGLPVTFPLPAPIAYPAPLSAGGKMVLDQITARITRLQTEGVVFLQLDTRSSDYAYPFTETLARDLAGRGYLVVSFSRTGLTLPAVLDVDITAITPLDTIELLRSLRRRTSEIFVISVNSLLWPISAALHIPNLGLHVFRDDAMHQYHYPNIYVVTEYFYPRLSPFHQFQTVAAECEHWMSAAGQILFTDYRPNHVVRCFAEMRERLADMAARSTPKAEPVEMEPGGVLDCTE
jgi:hypothetical protein